MLLSYVSFHTVYNGQSSLKVHGSSLVTVVSLNISPLVPNCLYENLTIPFGFPGKDLVINYPIGTNLSKKPGEAPAMFAPNCV